MLAMLKFKKNYWHMYPKLTGHVFSLGAGDFTSAVLHCTDSAPGPDGLPYSAFFPLAQHTGFALSLVYNSMDNIDCLPLS
eukprot:12880905-Prorocentrum_lima.AAC.1